LRHVLNPKPAPLLKTTILLIPIYDKSRVFYNQPKTGFLRLYSRAFFSPVVAVRGDAVAVRGDAVAVRGVWAGLAL